MKVLVLTGGTFPEKEKTLPVLKTILGSSFPKNIFIIAADSGLKIAEDYNLTPDLILGDLDSVSEKTLSKFENLPTNIFIRDKDCPDTELALTKAKEKNPEITVLLGGGGGRIDHLFSIERFFETDFAPDFWIPDGNIIAKIEAIPETTNIPDSRFLPDCDSENKIPNFSKNSFCWNDFFSRETLEELFSTEYDEKTEIDDRLMISVFPVKSPVKFPAKYNPEIKAGEKMTAGSEKILSPENSFSIQDEGLFWPLKNVQWHNGEYSLSNRPSSIKIPVRLTARQGRFIVIFRT